MKKNTKNCTFGYVLKYVPYPTECYLYSLTIDSVNDIIFDSVYGVRYNNQFGVRNSRFGVRRDTSGSFNVNAIRYLVEKIPSYFRISYIKSPL